jgi:hypothetical protein
MPQKGLLDVTTLHRHIVDCAAVTSGLTVIYASIEVLLLKMQPVVSLKARALLVIMAFMGMGSLYARLRDVSLRVTGTMNSSSERVRLVHDLVYTWGFNLVLSPLVYAVAGATHTQILLGTATTLLVSIITGPMNGAMIDRFRSWARLPNSGRFRMPETPCYGCVLGVVGMAISYLAVLYGVVAN